MQSSCLVGLQQLVVSDQVLDRLVQEQHVVQAFRTKNMFGI